MLERLLANDAKFNLPLGTSHCLDPQPAKAFFELVPADVKTVSIQQLNGAEKFTVLRNNIYRGDYLGPLGLEAPYLKHVAQIASSTPVFRISRPKTGFHVDGVLGAVLEAAAGLNPEN